MSLILRVGLSPPDILLHLALTLEVLDFDGTIRTGKSVSVCNELVVQN